jgi:hypothetical protein
MSLQKVVAGVLRAVGLLLISRISTFSSDASHSTVARENFFRGVPASFGADAATKPYRKLPPRRTQSNAAC